MDANTPHPSDIHLNAWVSQTRQNPAEAVSQSTFVKPRIDGHQGSSPTPISLAVKQLAEGMETIAHQNTLLIEENRMIRKANEALSKRRRAKKASVCHGGDLNGEGISDILARKEIEEQLARDIRRNRGYNRERPATTRRCGNCGELGHNIRTYRIEVEISEVFGFE